MWWPVLLNVPKTSSTLAPSTIGRPISPPLTLLDESTMLGQFFGVEMNSWKPREKVVRIAVVVVVVVVVEVGESKEGETAVVVLLLLTMLMIVAAAGHVYFVVVSRRIRPLPAQWPARSQAASSPWSPSSDSVAAPAAARASRMRRGKAAP